MENSFINSNLNNTPNHLEISYSLHEDVLIVKLEVHINTPLEFL